MWDRNAKRVNILLKNYEQLRICSSQSKQRFILFACGEPYLLFAGLQRLLTLGGDAAVIQRFACAVIDFHELLGCKKGNGGNE